MIRKLGRKVRLAEGPAEVACTNFYLDDEEWGVLRALPVGSSARDGTSSELEELIVAVDEREDGSLVAESMTMTIPSSFVPEWLDVVHDVSGGGAWTGAQLAR